MAISNDFFPSLKQLVPTSLVPEQLSFIQNGVDAILSNLFYRDFQAQYSYSGDAASFNLTVLSYTRIGFEFPGTGGLSLVVNPAIGAQNYTELPVSVEVQLEILRYLGEFKHSSFLEDPTSFYNLFLSIADTSNGEILLGILEEFYSANEGVEEFANNFNSKRSTSISVDLQIGSLIGQANDLIEQINISHSFIQTIFEDYILGDNFSDSIENLVRLFKVFFGEFDIDDVKRLLFPSISISLEQLTVALEFPRTVFIPLDLNDEVITDENVKTLMSFDVGSMKYSTERNFEFKGEGNFSFQKSQLGKSGFSLELIDMRLDLSRETNIPEADADGRPVDFIGAYITEGTIGFPVFWNHNESNSTGVIKARNLLVGTGGISGKLALEAKTNGNPSPLIKAKFGSGFEISLDAFAIEFQQNAIIGSDIAGTMKVPKFKDANGNDAKLDIRVHIGQDGDFKVTVKEEDGIQLAIKDILTINLKSASVGREDDRFFLSVSGSIDFSNGGQLLSQILPTPIQFQEIIIWDDGQFEIKGGGLELPKALTLKYPPVELSITSIHMGSVERDFEVSANNVVKRKYKYLGLDGAVKVDPGGVEAKGKGIQVYFSPKDDVFPEKHVFLRIESIAIDLIIPGDADPKDAALILKGFLAMKDPPPGIEGTEYSGGITIDLPKPKIGGSAAMRFNPKVPYFIIDVEVELSKAIPLGSTGLGLYGFRGLIGKHFVASKAAAGVTEDEPWWKYYKAKIAPDNEEGIQISKFEPKSGFALGFGVSLATSSDGGKVFSSKIFFLLSLRELFMFQGQAAIMKERIQLGDPNDPPFFALIVITKNSVEAALGVNYLLPDDKDPGSIATIQGVLELGFFFKDRSAWYLNIGRDLPESYRIQVRLFDIFDVYFYFMLSGKGIRAGAGASFGVHKKFGPLEAKLWAYLDIAGKIAYKPKQIGGSIQLGGGVELSIFGLGFSISAAASLAAESPEPFIVTGAVQVCIKVLKKERCAKFEFEWIRNENIDTTEVGLIDRLDIGGSCQAVNIQTRETFPLNFVKGDSGIVYRGTSNPSTWLPPSPGASQWNGAFENYIIPLDCFVDIEFKNGMNPNGGVSTNKFGFFGGAESLQLVPPQKGKPPQVYHDFKAEEIFIYSWNETTQGWVEYDIYAPLMVLAQNEVEGFVAPNTSNLKAGYWQMEAPNKYNNRVTPLNLKT